MLNPPGVHINSLPFARFQICTAISQLFHTSSTRYLISTQPALTPRRTRLYAWVVEINLTPDQRDFVRRAIESGRLSREEDAIREALTLWEDRERRRVEILDAIDEAEASLAQGEGREINLDSSRNLAENVKRRGRQRLAQKPHRR